MAGTFFTLGGGESIAMWVGRTAVEFRGSFLALVNKKRLARVKCNQIRDMIEPWKG